MNDLGWGRAGGNGGNSGNKGSGGGSGGGSVCMAHEDGVYVGNGSGVEGARKASGGCGRGAR